MSEIPAKIKVDLIYSPLVNFAMQQNHVPVIRKLTIKNIRDVDLSNLSIEIIPEPDFAITWNKKIDILPKDDLIDLGPVDIKSSTKYLAELTERIVGSFSLPLKLTTKSYLMRCIRLISCLMSNGVA